MQGFFAELDQTTRDAFKARGRSKVWPRGSTLFNEGEISDRVVVITEGRVKLSYFTDEGREIVLGIRGPGEILGELAVLDGQPRSATATVLDEVTGLVVAAEDFKAFINDNPQIAVQLLITMSGRLRDADRKRVEFGSLDTVGRVASRLVELAGEFGERTAAGIRIEAALSQQDLAGWTGASREAVSKALQNLRSRGWIETHRRAITILDLDALTRRASG